MNKGLPPLIELVNASVMRSDQVVLRDLNLRIEVGEHVAILGPNGCGKSTLVRTLTREFYPLWREGSTVRLFGREKWNVFELWSLLGIVSNHFPVPSRTVTGRELVIGSFFSSVGLWPIHEVTREMEEKADAALAQLDATHLAKRDYEELSSGEARRILIARALVHSPKALLLDEPSTSLDLAAQHELRETMRRLAQSGIAILLVTHHLSDIIPEIDRVVMMKAGQIVADGARAELLTQGPIESLFGVPLDLAERDGYIHAW
ncbi:MAG TPA: ATP-binding cassette domain-containing protein [Bryobacteraceae bacterium]|nr:ATP-binding cassette domain-containing protein [Bryobacteraceae bacterium]